eukprot:10151592-Alexandrium_andersonii.AAC.1
MSGSGQPALMASAARAARDGHWSSHLSGPIRSAIWRWGSRKAARTERGQAVLDTHRGARATAGKGLRPRRWAMLGTNGMTVQRSP